MRKKAKITTEVREKLALSLKVFSLTNSINYLYAYSHFSHFP